MTGKMFYADGLKFSCQKCSYCCRGEPGYVYLSKNDLKKLLDFFSLNKDEFVKKYCRFVPYHDGNYVLCLLETKENDCIFWTDKGCSCYQARPVQCRTYPFWTYLLQDKNNWDSEASRCPGINNGKLHGVDEIKQSMIMYEFNEPMTKEKVNSYEN